MARNFCLLILFTCSLFANENFWFSYRGVSENKLIIYEERNISPSMNYTQKNKHQFLCNIDVKKKKFQSTTNYLNQNFNKVLTCFYPMSSRVVNQTIVELKGVLETIELTIIPTKFTVDFKDQFANISILK